MLDHNTKNDKDVWNDWTVIEIMGWLSRTTLDIIGLTAFSHSIGALENIDNKLAAAFKVLLSPPKLTSFTIVLMFLVRSFPFLANLPTRNARNVKAAFASMESEGRKMVEIRKEWAESGDLDDRTDLMSLMVKASLNASNSKDKMLDIELMGQVATFVR